MKNIFKLFIVGLITLTFASVSFAQATPSTPPEKKEEKAKKEEKGTKTQKKGEDKAKSGEKKDEKATK